MVERAYPAASDVEECAQVGAGDVRVESIPDARIVEPSEPLKVMVKP
ncbi:MAG: hypothetical protein ACJ74T_03680 [Pyrinomonadaceae bacterium]